jgi:hypothetical protein
MLMRFNGWAAAEQAMLSAGKSLCCRGPGNINMVASVSLASVWLEVQQNCHMTMHAAEGQLATSIHGLR